MGIVIILLSLALFAKKVLHVNLFQIGNPKPIVQNLIQTPNPTITSQNFQMQIYASGLTNARVITFDSAGVPLVSLTASGRVVALPDTDKNLQADQTITVIDNLRQPHGLAFSENTLFVAETHQVVSYTYNPQNFSVSNKRVLLTLPAGGGHFTRSLLVKEAKLYTSIGSSCNVCRETDSHRAAILQSNLDGSELKIFATGLRNSVFQTVNPDTNEIWLTEMGRDNLGDDLPPDEINILRENSNYGWPICYGNKIHDSQFDNNRYLRDPCADTIATTIDLPAHSAPLGLAFAPDNWNEQAGKLFVAFHGSWNRSTPTGYKVVSVDPITGIVTDLFTNQDYSRYISRPVDLKFNSADQLFISDDKLNHLVVVTY